MHRQLPSLTTRQIAAALGKICRYAGKGAFYSVLLHSFVVADLVPDKLKLWALVHDQSEAHTSDVVTTFKNCEFRRREHALQMEMLKGQGIAPPTRHAHHRIKHADLRARNAEIWSGVGDTRLRDEFPVGDSEAEKLTLKYNRKYPARDQINSKGQAVAEFVKRFEQYKKEIQQ